MRSPLKLLKITHSISLLLVMGTVAIATALVLVVDGRLKSEGKANATARQTASIRVGATLLELAQPGTSVTWPQAGDLPRVVVDKIPDFSSNDLIDRISRITGEPATIFAYDAAKDDFVRVTTSIKKPDGTRAVGTVLGKASAASAPVRRGETFMGEANILDTPYLTIYVPVFDKANQVVGILFAGVKNADVYATAEALSLRIAAISAALVFVGVILGIMVARALAKPITVLADLTTRISKDEAVGQVPYCDWRNEIGTLANAVSVLQDRIEDRKRLQANQDREQAARDTRQKTIEAAVRDFEAEIGRVVTTVSTASGRLEVAATQLTKTAGNTEHLSTTVAAASEQMSANVQGVAAASEELASTVTEISRQVQESSAIASQAVTQAASTTDQVTQLSQCATRIGDVVSLITTIAGQTNLLALNATIEAARAGDAGKGFAVVAQEVKALAAQTGKATSEISDQISSMQAATQEAVQAIQEIATTINRMSEISGAIAAAVEQQDATTKEITRNVHEAAKGTSEVAGNINEVSQGAAETGSASGQVLTSAKQLAGESSALRREVDNFLATVRAA